MKKYLISFIVLFLLTLHVPRYPLYTLAQYGQYGQPSPSYAILVDKMVGKPSQNKGATSYEYVDNLSPSDPRFSPNQQVYFKIKVKNTSNSDITNVEVKDYVPLYLEPIEGPGTWDSQNRIISWNAGDFKVDEEKVYYIKMRVYDQKNLPSDKGLFCIVNRAQAWFNNTTDDDTAQLCIEKQVLGVKEVPTAGPEMGILILAGNLLTAGVGIYIKRKN
jgi:uncharacterized repeat protein (TIGR01451 family)